MTTEYDHTKKWYVILNGRAYYANDFFQAFSFAKTWNAGTPKPIQ